MLLRSVTMTNQEFLEGLLELVEAHENGEL